jgi:putative transcriptional regulator
LTNNEPLYNIKSYGQQYVVRKEDIKLKSQPRQPLIDLRNSLKLKQKDVAKSIGITISYYGMIELGVRNPTLELAKKIAEYFGKNMEDIFFADTNNKLLCNTSDSVSSM